MADLRKYQATEILNKLFDDGSSTVDLKGMTADEVVSAVLDDTETHLNVGLKGGTITGDVVIAAGNGEAGDLTVQGTSTVNLDSTVIGNFDVEGNFKVHTADGTEERVHIYSGDAASSTFMALKNASETTTVKVASADPTYFNGGNVGIGTTNPTAKLEINGDIVLGQGASLIPNANGAITVTHSHHKLAPTSSDDLNTIDGGMNGQTVVLRIHDKTAAVNILDAASINGDNIHLSGSIDFLLSHETDTITLMYFDDLWDGEAVYSGWCEVSRSNNG